MASSGTRSRPDAPRQPLLGHRGPDAVAAWRGAEPVSAGTFLGEVTRLAAALPDAGHVLNLCGDRYRFALAFLAAVIRGQVTLLPPTTTPNVVRAMRAFAPDAYCVGDAADAAVDMPRFAMPDCAGDSAAWSAMPAIAAEQAIACVFTSGSTGEPQPHFKSWGGIALDVRSEARRLGVGPGHAILGTVPPQHMYGFESTVMLPLSSGAAMSAERPYYPGDIDAALARLPAPRILFTTPFHLRAWLAAGDPAPVETVVSATAPLSLALAREAEARTGARLLEIYGCTEAGQIATRRPCADETWELYEGLRLAARGEAVVVSGGHVERPVALQDVIEIRGDARRFALHGRFADMVNIAGKRNSLAYLNHQLAAIPGVEDGIFCMPDDEPRDGVARLVAFVVAPTLTARQVLAALRERLDPAFVPRPLFLVARLPREATGKLTREALRRLAAQARAGTRGAA